MNQNKDFRTALALSIFTIVYNIVEGSVSVYFGASDETLALFGFGVDSFVEVISGFGIAHMIWRMQRSSVDQRDHFEVTALRITGFAFYLLVLGLLVGAALSLINQNEPNTTVVGIIISSLSIIIMYLLYKAKLKVGRRLNSQPIISDANCTKTCFYLSFILLTSSLLYEFLDIPYVDAIGSIGIAYFAFKEGREALEMAKSKRLACSDNCG